MTEQSAPSCQKWHWEIRSSALAYAQDVVPSSDDVEICMQFVEWAYSEQDAVA
jgi:hypothetical protein